MRFKSKNASHKHQYVSTYAMADEKVKTIYKSAKYFTKYKSCVLQINAVRIAQLAAKLTYVK